MSTEREVLTYELFGRGGLALGMGLGYALGVKNLSVVNVEFHSKPHSVITPDYSWRSTEQWIDFPWSVLPPVVPGALAH